MLTIELRDEEGNPMRDVLGAFVTMTLATPDGFVPFPWVHDTDVSIVRELNALGESAAAERLAVLSEHVIAWSGFSYEGSPLPCTYFAVERVLLTNPSIRSQVERAIVDAAIKHVSKSAAN